VPAMATEFKKDKAVFKNLVPLDALADAALDQLIRHVPVEHAPKGKMLFREGDEDQRHIYLLEGQVQLLSKDREFEIVKSGTQSARFALAHQWPRKFSGRAIEEVYFIRIPSKVLHSLVVRSSQAKSKSDQAEEPGTDCMTLALNARVLQHVSPADIQKVLVRMEEVPVKNDETVIRQGDPGDYFYIIAKGTGVVTRTDPKGERQLAVLSPGDGFGEDSLISGEPRAASITMASDGVLIRLPKDDFLEFVRRPLVKGKKINEARKLVEEGAVWLDIRHPEEYAENHYPDAINLPLETLRERCDAYPNDKQYIVYGPQNQSEVGTFLLRERGFNVFLLENWKPGQIRRVDEDDSTLIDIDDDNAKTSAPSEQQEDFEAQLTKHKEIIDQKTSEIEKLEQKLKASIEKNKRLEQDLEQALKNSADASADKAAPLQKRIKQLELEYTELQEERDTISALLDDSTAQESKLSWKYEKIREELENYKKAQN